MPFSHDELDHASGKSPGCDNIPYEALRVDFRLERKQVSPERRIRGLRSAARDLQLAQCLGGAGRERLGNEGTPSGQLAQMNEH